MSILEKTNHSPKVGNMVNIPHGKGIVKFIETVCDKHPRAGVKHDIQPKGFTDEILYYFFNEITKI
jgi:hypothetical protein